uniref:Natriuretic peptides A n=1 Tax=Serinus canaria TaxID=9135 RepID=A0A8C9MI25_SERCA
MDTKGSFFYGFLLLLLIQLQPSRANPIYSLSPAKELASMEALLERLEDKFAMMEALESNPDLQEPKTQEEILSELADDGDNQKAEPRLAPNTPLSYRDPFLKRLRGLQMPRMMRDSGCFGRRIDRIGSLSGMGCNGEQNQILVTFVSCLVCRFPEKLGSTSLEPALKNALQYPFLPR